MLCSIQLEDVLHYLFVNDLCHGHSHNALHMPDCHSAHATAHATAHVMAHAMAHAMAHVTTHLMAHVAVVPTAHVMAW